MFRSGASGGSIMYRSSGGGLCRSGGVFVVEVVERIELVLGCVVGCVARLVLSCVDGRGCFLCCFSLKLVEMSGLSVGGFLLGMLIWADCFFFWNVVSRARW